MERGGSFLESLPQEMLEAIVSRSDNIRNVRKASKTLRSDLGGSLGGLTLMSYRLGSNAPVFSLVERYLHPTDIKNVKLASTGAYHLIEKDWKDMLDEELKNTNPERVKRKIYDFLDLYKGQKFENILKYVVDQYNIDPFVYLNRSDIIRPDLVQLILNFNVMNKEFVKKGEYYYFNPIHSLAYKFRRIPAENIQLKIIQTMIRLYEFGFNPNYKDIYDSNVYLILGDKIAEEIFKIPQSKLPESYALPGSKLENLINQVKSL